MVFTHAITRLPGENFAEGLTTSNLGKPSYPLILEQHRAYRQALLGLGLDVMVLPAELVFPDGYFVEDPCIITPKIAILTHVGAPSRRGEGDTLEPFIEYYRPVAHILPPGTVDGGDVLMADNHFFIGISERTNIEGAAQLASILQAAGHTCETVPVGAGLHLKSSANYLGNHIMLVTHALADFSGFASYQKIVVEPEEEYAANSLWVNGSLLVPDGYPKTHNMLKQASFSIIELDVSEVRKMDGGLTCMSLRF